VYLWQNGTMRNAPIPWLTSFLPHHALSRVTHRLARWETRRIQPVLRWFVRHYAVDLAEAAESRLESYASFNQFFTRALHPDARPLPNDADSLLSPVDGQVSAVGRIEEGLLLQAKGHRYRVVELLGGESALATPFQNGHYLTAYLSPRDYHRVHMPLAGRLTRMVHVPGRLFSVSPSTVQGLPGVFARNERVIAFFDTPIGPCALALIGAMNVGSIETVWAGEVTPPAGRWVRHWQYAPTDPALQFARGDEMGRFNLGSSVILLLPDRALQWNAGLQSGEVLRVRQELARFPERIA
jgi:phosphatidylserine decarboxylase